MTRADELAYKFYPIPEDNNPTIHQQHCYGRQGFLLGYQQAEKDLALTWEDLKLLWQIRWEMPVTWEDTEEEWYKELLKRFNEKKKLTK